MSERFPVQSPIEWVEMLRRGLNERRERERYDAMNTHPANGLHRVQSVQDAERALTERLYLFVAEFAFWWHEAGRHFYGRSMPEYDEGMRLIALDAVAVLGGWRATRRLLRKMPRTGIDWARRPSNWKRGIFLRDDEVTL